MKTTKPVKPCKPWHRKITRKHIATHAVAAALAAGAMYGATPHTTTTMNAPSYATALPTPICDASINDHVYHSYRLQVLDPCIRATGTIQFIRQEPDGDDHLQLVLDQQYVNLKNQVNDAKQNGALVLEIVCQHQASQVDAIPSCMNYQNQIPEPTIGEHVEAIGQYVIDNDHGGWAEIHPLTSLVMH